MEEYRSYSMDVKRRRGWLLCACALYTLEKLQKVRFRSHLGKCNEAKTTGSTSSSGILCNEGVQLGLPLVTIDTSVWLSITEKRRDSYLGDMVSAQMEIDGV